MSGNVTAWEGIFSGVGVLGLGWLGGYVRDRRHKSVQAEKAHEENLHDLYVAWNGEEPTKSTPNPSLGGGARLLKLEREMAALTARVDQALPLLQTLIARTERNGGKNPNNIADAIERLGQMLKPHAFKKSTGEGCDLCHRQMNDEIHSLFGVDKK